MPLNNKDGGIRPIAAGSSLRRLVAKAACKAVTSKTSSRFFPVQIGFGVPQAAEAAAHAVRVYFSGLQPGEDPLQLDFKNAFNMVRRDTMFQIVYEELPELNPIIRHLYSTLVSTHYCPTKGSNRVTHLVRCCFAPLR